MAPGAVAGTFDNRAYVTTPDDPVTAPPPCTDTEAVAADNNVDCETTPVASSITTALASECVNNAPYITYDITPFGFTPSGGATLTFYDLDGNLVDSTHVADLTGRVLYPGAQVDAAGIATDWPGWKFENGQWVVDPTDAHLRDGLRVVVEVNPTSEGTVSYPAADVGVRRPGASAPDDAAADHRAANDRAARRAAARSAAVDGFQFHGPVRARSIRPDRGRRPDTAARPAAPHRSLTRDAGGTNAAIGAHHIREARSGSSSTRARCGRLVMSFVTSLAQNRGLDRASRIEPARWWTMRVVLPVEDVNRACGASKGRVTPVAKGYVRGR